MKYIKISNKVIDLLCDKAFRMGIRFSYNESNKAIVLNGVEYEVSIAYRLLFEA